jgi:poly(A) polymerase
MVLRDLGPVGNTRFRAPERVGHLLRDHGEMEITDRLAPQDWMIAPETLAVVAALTADGAEVRFVGGCVRDAVLGRQVNDVDIATPDRPETVMALIERAGLKAVPTGLAHGTVTAVSGHRPYEVTTLRHDVETYGRHAKVAFTGDWAADAARRDLTINALFCAPDGRLYDYTGGLADLRSGRVRFVGAANQRIAEDYLRLLRFFRFHAHYGQGAPDAEAVAAAAEAAPRLVQLSGERVRGELFRLLEAPDPVPVLRVMADNRILAAELPEARDLDSLLLRLAAWLTADAAGARSVALRLRLSNAERDRLVGLIAPEPAADPGMSRDELRRALYRLGPARVLDLLRLAVVRSGSGEGFEAALAEVAAWRPVSFPLKGRDLRARGLPRSPRLGRLLAALEAWWIDHDFGPDREACLAELDSWLGEGE